MDDSRNILLSGLNSLGLPVEEEKIEALLAFIRLIEKWNKAYNLTAIRNWLDILRLHILDSLTAFSYLQGPRIIDFGTGAGLPGIPLAIFARENRFTLLDSNAKKTRFVQQAVLELNLTNVEIIHSRVEIYKPENLFDTVICRAFAEIRDIIDCSDHLLSENGILLAMKGHNPKRELNQLTRQATVFPIKVPGVDAERCLVKIKKPSINNG